MNSGRTGALSVLSSTSLYNVLYVCMSGAMGDCSIARVKLILYGKSAAAYTALRSGFRWDPGRT